MPYNIPEDEDDLLLNNPQAAPTQPPVQENIPVPGASALSTSPLVPPQPPLATPQIPPSVYQPPEGDQEELFTGESWGIPEELDRGFFGDAATALGRGVGSAIESTGAGLEALGAGTTGKFWKEQGRGMAESDLLRPDDAEVAGEDGTVKRTFISALESLPSSMVPLITGAAGAAVGSLAGPGGTLYGGYTGATIGGVAGGAAGLATVFGAGTYGLEKERFLKEKANSGLSVEQLEEDAHDFALSQSLWETIPEAASDVVAAGTFGVSKLLLSGIGATGATATLKGLLSQGPKEFARQFGKAYLKSMPVEALSEMVTYWGQATGMKEAGLGDGPIAQGFIDAAATSVWLTGMMGGGMQAYSQRARNRIAEAIKSNNPVMRGRAADRIQEGIAKEYGAERAQEWRDSAEKTFATGGTIDMTSPIFGAVQEAEPTSTDTANTEPQGVLARALGSVFASEGDTVETSRGVESQEDLSAMAAQQQLNGMRAAGIPIDPLDPTHAELLYVANEGSAPPRRVPVTGAGTQKSDTSPAEAQTGDGFRTTISSGEEFQELLKREKSDREAKDYTRIRNIPESQRTAAEVARFNLLTKAEEGRKAESAQRQKQAVSEFDKQYKKEWEKTFEIAERKDLAKGMTAVAYMDASAEKVFERIAKEYTRIRGELIAGNDVSAQEKATFKRLGGYVGEPLSEQERLLKDYQENITVPKTFPIDSFYPKRKLTYEEKLKLAVNGESAFPIEELTEDERFNRDVSDYNKIKNIPKEDRNAVQQFRLDELTNRLDLILSGEYEKAIGEQGKSLDKVSSGPGVVAKEQSKLSQRAKNRAKKKKTGTRVIKKEAGKEGERTTLGEMVPKEFQESYRNISEMNTITSNPEYKKSLPRRTERVMNKAALVKQDLNDIEASVLKSKKHLVSVFEREGVSSIDIKYKNRDYTVKKPVVSEGVPYLSNKGSQEVADLWVRMQDAGKVLIDPKEGKRTLKIQTERPGASTISRFGPKDLNAAAVEHVAQLDKQGKVGEELAAIREIIEAEVIPVLANKGIGHRWRSLNNKASFHIARASSAKKFLTEEAPVEFAKKKAEIESRELKPAKKKYSSAGVSPDQAQGFTGRGAKAKREEFKSGVRENLKFSKATGELLPSKQANVSKELLSSIPEKVINELKSSGNLDIITNEEALRLAGKSGAEVKLSPGERIEAIALPSGKIVLVQGNIETGRVAGVLTHELGVHVRQLGFKGERSFKSILKQIDNLISGKDKDILAARALVPEGTPDTDVAEETLGQLAANSPEHGLVRKLLAALKRFLLDRGWRIKLSPADLQSLAQQVIKISSAPVESNSNNAKFSITGATPRVKAMLDEAKLPPDQESYDKFYSNEGEETSARYAARRTKALIRDSRNTVDKYLGAISSRLRKWSPEIEKKLRRMEIEGISKPIHDFTTAVEPLMKITKEKMTKRDYSDWKMARYIDDQRKINDLVRKYRLEVEYGKAQKVISDLRNLKTDAGLDPDQTEGSWPRAIKDMQGFLRHIERGDMLPVFSDAMEAKARQLGIKKENLTDDTRAKVATSVIIGRGAGKNGNLLNNEFKTVPRELLQYLFDPDAALIASIREAVTSSAYRKFFGKTGEKMAVIRKRLSKVEKKLTGKGISAEDRAELENVGTELRQILARNEQGDFTQPIGVLVAELEAQGLSPEGQKEIRDTLMARFQERGTSGALRAYKNLSLIDTMGSYASALTQVGDFASPMYNAGMFETGRALRRAITGKQRISAKELGADDIAEEFTDSGKIGAAVNKIFKLTGLSYMNRVARDTFLNSAFEQFKKEAIADQIKLKAKIKPMFLKETDSVIQDLLNDDVTDNVRLLVFDRLLDFQPVTKSEMPEKYLTAGNGRLFYSLKSYTIKQFDSYRREIVTGLKSDSKQERVQALKNMARLGMFLVLANASADELKDFMLGRESTLSDRVVDNILRLGGISRFVTWQARREGIGSAAAKQILPPFKLLDALTRDVYSFGDDNGFKSLDSVPLVGKLAYWRLGQGAEKKHDIWEIRYQKQKQRINKFNNRLERSKDKKKFISDNRDDFALSLRIRKFQGRLNRNQKKINKLESLEPSKAIHARIDSFKDARSEMTKNFLDKI